MNSPIANLDLNRQPPHSPRHRIAGFVIAARAVDKCRATLAGTPGEYHYGCPLDNLLFHFKGITAAQFKRAVQDSNNYEDIGRWLLTNGTIKTEDQIKEWSDQMEAASPMNNPEKRVYFIEHCSALGLGPETTSTFDWLETDDRTSFNHNGFNLEAA